MVLISIIFICLCEVLLGVNLVPLASGEALVFNENTMTQLLPPRSDKSLNGKRYYVDKPSFSYIFSNELIAEGSYGTDDYYQTIDDMMTFADTGYYYFTDNLMIASFPDDPEEFVYYLDCNRILWIEAVWSGDYYAWGMISEDGSEIYLFEDGIPMILRAQRSDEQ